MDKRGITAKDVQKYLNLASVQSIYNWCRGINMPTVDSLYALSQLFQVPIDSMICPNTIDNLGNYDYYNRNSLNCQEAFL